MIAYCISGLGADESIFDYLALDYPKVCIAWQPATEWDSMSAYADKLCLHIDTSIPFVLIGVSFGGMLAIEMSKKVRPLATILINSVARRSELPWWIKWTARTRLNRILPTSLFTLHPLWLIWLFRIKSARGKEMIRSLAAKNDNALAKCSIDMIMTWQNEWLPDRLLRIYAEKDLLLPSDNLGGLRIANAGHFTVVENAEEVSSKVNSFLSNLDIGNT